MHIYWSQTILTHAFIIKSGVNFNFEKSACCYSKKYETGQICIYFFISKNLAILFLQILNLR